MQVNNYFFGTKAYELNSLYWIIHRVKIHTCNACRKTTLNSPTFQRIWPQWSRSTVIEFVVWLQETTGTDCWLYVTSVGRHSENGVWCEFSANRYRTRSSASLRAITNILFSSRTSSIEPTKKNEVKPFTINWCHCWRCPKWSTADDAYYIVLSIPGPILKNPKYYASSSGIVPTRNINWAR